MKKINMQNEANLNAKGIRSNGNCKPVICLETGDVYSSQADAAEAIGSTHANMSIHLCGKSRHVKGKHFCYVSRVNENLNSILTQFREVSAMEEDARKWREHQAKLEAERLAAEKEMEELRKAQEKREKAIEKAKAKVAKFQSAYDKYEAKIMEAAAKLMEAEKELEALEDEVA